MRTTKRVTVVHPDSKVRLALRSVLEEHGCTAATSLSCRELLTAPSDAPPDLILLDRSLLVQEGFDVLFQLNHRWIETEIVFMPEGLVPESGKPQLLKIVDRFLQMRTTREILAF